MGSGRRLKLYEKLRRKRRRNRSRLSSAVRADAVFQQWPIRLKMILQNRVQQVHIDVLGLTEDHGTF